MGVLDKSVNTLKNKAMPLALVSWNRHTPGEATWEQDDINASVTINYLHLTW